MNTNTSQLIQLIVILGLFIGLFIYLGLSALIRYWRNSSVDEMKEIHKKLRDFQEKIQKNRQFLLIYSPQDPEPFGPLAAELNHQISRTDRQLQTFYREYAAIQSNIKSLDTDDLLVILRLPQSWWKIRTQLEKFRESTDQLAKSIEESNVLIEKLENQSQEISGRARLLLQNLEHSLQTLDQLEGLKVKDPVLDAANQSMNQWQTKLRLELPAVFLTNDPALLAKNTDKQMVIDVFSLLNKAGPELETMQTRIEKNLLDIEQLNQDYQSILTKRESLLKQFGSLEQSTEHPLILDQSKPQLDELVKITAPMSTTDVERDLKKLETDVVQVEKAHKTLEQLGEAYQRIDALYRNIISIWNTPEVAQGRNWLRGAIKLSDQINEFDPDNWPANLGLTLIRNDLVGLMNQQSRLVPSKSSTPIKESELAPLNEELLHLLDAHQVIRPRFQRIQERFIEIQQTERTVQEPLIRSQALLTQAVSVIASNSFLTKTASKEVQKLIDALVKMLEELDERSRGLIDKKARKASLLIRQIEESAQKWADSLDNNLEVIKDTLEGKLAEIEKIGPLDEAVIMEARNLLIQSKTPGNVLTQSSEIDFPLANSIKHLKQSSEIWQRSIATTRALEDVTGPLVSRYQKANEYRQKATEKLAKALELIPERRDWPPTNQVLTGEQNQFKQLEDAWQVLSHQRISAMQYLAQLGNLSDQYQALANQVGQIADRAEEDVKKIQEAERRLEDSVKLWRHQINKNPGNLYIRDGVEELLNKNNDDLVLLKKRNQRGSLPYSQILSQLRLLGRNLDDALVPIDANQVIDINGVVQRNRPY